MNCAPQRLWRTPRRPEISSKPIALRSRYPALRNAHDGISDGIAATPEEGYRQLSDLIGRGQREAKARGVRAVLCALVEGIIIRQLPRTV